MIISLIIIWYLIGVAGHLYVFRKIQSYTSVGDAIYSVTIGGVLGIIGVLFSIMFLYSDKKLF